MIWVQIDVSQIGFYPTVIATSLVRKECPVRVLISFIAYDLDVELRPDLCRNKPRAVCSTELFLHDDNKSPYQFYRL